VSAAVDAWEVTATQASADATQAASDAAIATTSQQTADASQALADQKRAEAAAEAQILADMFAEEPTGLAARAGRKK
jgi:hypothetical protein